MDEKRFLIGPRRTQSKLDSIGGNSLLNDALCPTVSICCLTYNHAAYIREALDSMLAQHTDFPFEILIHDDASTDETVEILEEYRGRYPNIVRLFLEEENQLQKEGCRDFIRGLMAENARGKYIAECEGDDYWIDSNKLQKQVDYLDRHPECSEVCHAALKVNMQAEDDVELMGYGSLSRILSVEDVILRWNIPTASRMFRKKDAPEYMKTWAFPMPVWDFPTAVYSVSVGNIYYDSCPMSVYRYKSSGSWTLGQADTLSSAETALNWLEMLNNIDSVTQGQFHNLLRQCAIPYFKKACMYLGFDRCSCHITEGLFEQLSYFEKITVIFKHILWKLGFDLQKTGKGGYRLVFFR